MLSLFWDANLVFFFCFFFLQEIKAFVPVKVTALLRICNVF